jgi:hypothetical protein
MVPGGSEAYVITLIELNVLVGSRDSHISPHRSKGMQRESVGPPASAQPEAQPSRVVSAPHWFQHHIMLISAEVDQRIEVGSAKCYVSSKTF